MRARDLTPVSCIIEINPESGQSIRGIEAHVEHITQLLGLLEQSGLATEIVGAEKAAQVTDGSFEHVRTGLACLRPVKADSCLGGFIEVIV